MSKNKFPKGWDEKRVCAVIDHYENQTEDEQVSELEAAYENAGYTLFAVPNELADEVRKLLASHQNA